MIRDRDEGKLVVSLGELEIALELHEPPEVHVGVGVLGIELNGPGVCVWSAVRIDLLEVEAQVVPLVAVQTVAFAQDDEVALGQGRHVVRQLPHGEVQLPLPRFHVPDLVVFPDHHVVAIGEDAHRCQRFDLAELRLQLQQYPVGLARGNVRVEQTLGAAEKHDVLEIEAVLAAVSTSRPQEAAPNVVTDLIGLKPDEIRDFPSGIPAHQIGRCGSFIGA